MSSERELLALRKEVLVARVALQRAQVAHDLLVLRENLRWPRAAAMVAGSAQGRSVLAALLFFLARRGRLARIASIAGAVVAVVQLARTIARGSTRQP